MRAVHRTAAGQKTKRLDLLADQLVKSGIAGDMDAIKEIGDRLDGKATQGVELAAGNGAGILGVILVPSKQDA